ncbi:hypothetical protein ACFLQ0_03300 [Nitrospinota bacterium]
MLGIIGFAFLVVGFGWGLEFLWEFRIEGLPYLYPFDEVTRRVAAIALLLIGVIIEWVESRSLKQRHQHV